MTRHLATGLALTSLSALALAACQPKPADTSKEVDALKAQASAYGADVKSKNIDKVMAYYADDAVVLQTGAPTATGAAAIKKSLAANLADPAYELTVTADTVSVASSGDWASIVGHADVTATNPNTHGVDHFTQNYLVTEKKDGGTWKLEAIAIAVPPAAAPAAHS